MNLRRGVRRLTPSSRIGKLLVAPLPIVVGNARAYEGPPGTHCRYTQQEEE